MEWLLDKLKLLGVVVLLLGGAVAFKLYNPFSHDNQIVERAGALAIEVCECISAECAERVLVKADEELSGQEVTRKTGGAGDAHTKAHEQIMYMRRCHQLLSEGKSFTINKKDGRIFMVNESLSEINIDFGAL